MYAIIQTGGKQIKVSVGDSIFIEKILLYFSRFGKIRLRGSSYVWLNALSLCAGIVLDVSLVHFTTETSNKRLILCFLHKITQT